MIAMRIEQKATIDSPPNLDPQSRATESYVKNAEPRAELWLIDPISFSGMAYSDVGQIDALQRLGAPAVLIGSDGWMLEPGIVRRITVFRGTRGPRSSVKKGFGYATSLVRLVRLIRARRPRVVHWQYSQLPAGEVVAMMAIRLLGTRQVYTAHELVPWTARRHHRWLFRRLYGVMDGVIVHNEEQRRELIRGFAVPASKVHTIPLGDYALFATPDMSQADAREALSLDATSPTALFFGAIRESKGLDVLLRAWAIVAKARPDFVLLIVGKPVHGIEANALRSQIEELGLAQHVRAVFEQVDPAQANLYYRAADVVVLPYHEIGTSGVLRYAYDSARPVVATAVGEHRTHVQEGETGHLVPPRDPDAMARVLEQVMDDRHALERMGLRARDYAMREMGWLDSGRSLLAVYDSLRDRDTP
jgi:glycosyltransferase involved in cell wall biosynthesis